MRIVIVNEKKSVSEEYIKTLQLQNITKEKYSVRGFSPVINKNVTIAWCRGHLVTMSYPEAYDEKYKKWNINDLPFLPEKYKYEVISDCKEQFQEIKAIYNSMSPGDELLLAGDSAREGLYIQLLVRQEAHVPKGVTEKVVWIDSFTEEEILRGIREAKPLVEYALKGHAAYMRAIEDYAIGMNFSRALSCKYGYRLNKAMGTSKWVSISIGRVMTTVQSMVVEREREIRNFKETPFYKINADNGAEWKAVEESHYFESPLLYCENGFKDKTKADELCRLLNTDKRLTVAEVKRTSEKKGAPLLFNLAEAQNFCGNKYKISPNEVLDVIQSLYEKKLVTYPRTDARVLSTAVAVEIEKNLKGLKGLGYKTDLVNEALSLGRYKTLSSSPYVDDSKISDHYAIIPTGAVAGYNSLSERERNIFHDIIERFLSIFFPAAIYEKTEVRFSHSKREYFFLNQKILKETGYLKLFDKEKDEQEEPLIYEKGQIIHAEFSIKEGKTTGPKRYTSSSMIIAMENAGKLIEDEELRATIKGCGIGTSATRGAILDKLVNIGYISLNRKTQVLTPTPIGESIYDIVKESIPQLTSPEMTANWELGLSQIEEDKVTYAQYKEKLEKYVRKEIDNIMASEATINAVAGSEVICPICKKGKILTSKNSKSYFCSEYKNGCKFSLWKNARGFDFSMADVKSLIENGKTKRVTLNKKDGSGTYSGHFTYADGKIDFELAKTKYKK